jgi:hypothetical protein
MITINDIIAESHKTNHQKQDAEQNNRNNNKTNGFNTTLFPGGPPPQY